ncbi:MAG: hypothetical protein MJ016_02315 [Victivallaceae bacterium]|nr:hypothetical protein [Victivallaceae bacterium]
MNLHPVDWLIVGLMLAMVFFLTWYFKRFVRGVSDFMAANRLAGGYMLAIAPGMIAASGLIGAFETTYNNGISSSWWSTLGLPISIVLTLFGFVQYRLRQTRALTLAQFLEERYSRKFRLFAGFLCWISGVLNYGVFPMVTARCMIALLDLPEKVSVCGMQIGLFPLVIFIFIAIGCSIACIGGQVCILVTGFFQNMIAMIGFLVLLYYMAYRFGWSDLTAGMFAAPDSATKSMVNPFKAFDADGFNIWYYVILILFNCYSRGCWQGGGGFNAAAKTPHDGLMSGIYSRWKSYAYYMIAVWIPLAAYAAFHLPQYADLVAPVNAKLALITDVATQNQMRVPMFLAQVLPAGLFGLFIVSVLAGTITTDSSYMHSWGTIFIQDIVMPIRKKPFEPKKHLLYLRLGIIGVALFAFFFSWLFPLKDFINMYFMITGAIYMGGAGAVVIGGLYWKRGSTCAAWTAMILGTIICLGGVILQSSWPHTGMWLHRLFPDWQYLAAHLDKFPIPSHILTLTTMIAAGGSYILVSLLGPKHVHNMDQLLHRGKYAVEGVAAPEKPKFTWSRLFGVSPEHTPFQRFLMYASFAIIMGVWIVFAVVTLFAICGDYLKAHDQAWIVIYFWRNVALYFFLGTVCTIWIVCGGLKDAVQLYKDVHNAKVDENDNGFVK